MIEMDFTKTCKYNFCWKCFYFHVCKHKFLYFSKDWALVRPLRPPSEKRRFIGGGVHWLRPEPPWKTWPKS